MSCIGSRAQRGHLDTGCIAGRCGVRDRRDRRARHGHRPRWHRQDDDAACCVRSARAQRRRMLVVAPTRKAASVASREVGAAASSIHALLADHGYRWGADQAGAKVWTRLRVGEIDPSTGVAYGGPAQYVLRSRDRIVVDEAGMVDLQTANVLVDLAIEQGVGLAFVGDPHQALPVGHSGAMGSAVRHANAAVELDTVHRFRDPEYAALTLRLRNTSDREHALAVAGELAERGHVERVDHHDAARERMIDAYFEWHARGKRVTLVPVPTLRRMPSTTRSSSGESITASWIPAWSRGGWGSSASSSVTPSRPAATTGSRASRIVRSGSCAASARSSSILCRLATAASCGECLPSMRGSTCSSPTRRRCMACRATPPMRRWSGRMWTRRACTSASPAGGCTT